MRIIKMLAVASVLVLLMAACKQQAVEMPQADFLLKFYKADSASGKSVAYTDHSLNMSGSAKAVLKYVFKENRIELQMGIVPGTNVEAHMQVLLVFKNTSVPSAVEGVYRFPEDSSRLAVEMKDRTTSTVLTYRDILDGQVEVQYDAFSKTFSGTLRYLRFRPLPGSEYDRLSLTGWFNDALLGE